MLTLLLVALLIMPDEQHGPGLLTQPPPTQSAVAPMIQPTAPCTLSKLVVTPRLRPFIDLMWQTSRTFQAQCARLSQAPGLLVSILFGNQSQVGARGRVLFVRSEGEVVRAEVLICHDFRSSVELVEVLAHELEHVIEQLDGVQLASDSSHGVHRTASGAFETARAQHVGQRVSDEVFAARTIALRSGPR